MKTYQILFSDGELNGMTLVRIADKNIRPLDAPLENELLRARDIALPSDTLIKYCKWKDGALVAMTESERAERDAKDEEDWQASEEYANRVRAIQIIGAIQATLIAIGVDANEKSQVFADVDAWVQASENDSEKISRLETAMRLQTYYVSLIELVGDATGLINGEREIDLTLGG